MSVADLIRAAGLSGAYGGIKLEIPAHASAVDSVHFVYDETAGFSALMNMFFRDPSAKLEERTWAGNKQWTMWAPMLALQSPDPAAGFPSGTVLAPMIFLRNASAKQVSAGITLTWRSDTVKGRVQLPPVSLKPFETRQLNIGPMQKQLGIPADAHWALVTLTSPASPDDLLAVAASYESTGRYGAQTPFSDNLGAYWAGGQWQVDATHNAIVAVTNGGNRATDALLTLHFAGGKKNYEIKQTIQPGDQMWLNLADLIHHSVPDSKGNMLPADITSGTYDLEDLNPGLGGNLIEGKVSLDKTWGHLSYGCLTCCGYTPYLVLDPTLVATGGDQGINADGTNICTGVGGYSLHTYFSQTNARWWSGNGSIATVTSFNGHGVAPGSTIGYATATVPNGDGGRPKPPCPQLTQEGNNQIKVGPYQVEPTATTAQGQAVCPQGQAGWARNVTNQVQYYTGAPFATGYNAVSDTLTYTAPNPLGISGTRTGTAGTNPDGSFPDTYSVCSAACPASTGEADALQNWTLAGYPLPHVNAVKYKCNSISIDGY